MHKSCFFLAVLVFGMAQSANAQTLGGVFAPGIKADDRSLQWRTSYSPEEDGGRDHFAARLHYQHSFSNRFRGRIWAAFSDIETDNQEFKFFQAEFHWQLRKPTGSSYWASGVRFDLRLTDGDDGANQVGVVFTNQWTPLDNFILTYASFYAVEFGVESRSGVFIESRSSIDYALDNGIKIGIHSFNTYGNSKSLGSFENQNHRLGPAISGKLPGNASFFIGPLFGISDNARNVDIRLWVGKRF